MVRRKALTLSFGRVVRARRLEMGVSQEELAYRSGIHPTYLSQLERGVKSPSLDVIAAIADALEESVNVLIKRAEETTQSEAVAQRRVKRSSSQKRTRKSP